MASLCAQEARDVDQLPPKTLAQSAALVDERRCFLAMDRRGTLEKSFDQSAAVGLDGSG